VTIRVLIADDERLVRTGLRMILESEPDIEVVGEAGNGRDALDEARRVRPHVILMDVRMPVLDGLAATAELADAATGVGGAPSPRVIVLTTFDLDEYVFGSLRAGASGFLLKDAPEAQLLAAIRTAADGGSMFAPSATRRLIAAFARRGAGHDTAAVARLTQREIEVLRLVARGRSNREIAAELTVTEHTAKTHIGHILDKLGLRDRTQAAVFAYEAGLAEGEID
jgi:DNA-binding NarL/FixJ family response regulator